MPVVKQVVKGKTVKFSEIDASTADMTDLQALLEGEVQIYDKKSEGGSVAPYPASLNRKKFSCGDRSTKLSCSVNIPHVKETAYVPDLEAVVVGSFDASYDSSTVCDYMNLQYDRN